MRSDATANREALVAAATALIAERGSRVPLIAVAERAGIGIATLYRNFPTRDVLLHAVAINIMDKAMNLVEGVAPGLDADAERAWPVLVHAIAEMQPGALVSALAADIIADGIPEELQRKRELGLAAMQGVIEKAKAAGLVRSDLTAARFQLGLATVTRPLPDLQAPEQASNTTWLVDIYLHGLRPDPETRKV